MPHGVRNSTDRYFTSSDLGQPYTRGIMQLHRNNLLTAIFILGCATAQAVYAQDSQITGVIIEDVRIFDGRSDQLSAPSNVLVVGNVIRTISSMPITDVPGMKGKQTRGGGGTPRRGRI